MKVIEKNKSNLVKMSDIKIGDCFKKGNVVYMRIADGAELVGVLYNRYVDIEDGEVYTRPGDSLVADCQRVKAHVEYEIID